MNISLRSVKWGLTLSKTDPRLKPLRDAIERLGSQRAAGKSLGLSVGTVSGLVHRNPDYFEGVVKSKTKQLSKPGARKAANPARRRAVSRQPAIQSIPKPVKRYYGSDQPFPLRTLMDLGENDCRYMIGELYCGRPVERGSYCASHGAGCYIKTRTGKASYEHTPPKRLPGRMK